MIQKLCVHPGPGHAVFLGLLPLGMEWGLSKVVNLRVNMPNSHHTLFQSWLRKASSPSTWTLKGGSKPFPVPKAEEVRFQPERVRPSPGKQPVCGILDSDSQSPTLLELWVNRDCDLAEVAHYSLLIPSPTLCAPSTLCVPVNYCFAAV